MSEKLRMTNAVESMLRRMAIGHGIDPDDAVADVKSGLPAARLLLELVTPEVASPKRGRPRDDALYQARYRRIVDLVESHGHRLGIEIAAVELKLSATRVRRIYGARKGDDGPARIYFDPSLVPPNDED